MEKAKERSGTNQHLQSFEMTQSEEHLVIYLLQFISREDSTKETTRRKEPYVLFIQVPHEASAFRLLLNHRTGSELISAFLPLSLRQSESLSGLAL
jgi:hypothetical protein